MRRLIPRLVAALLVLLVLVFTYQAVRTVLALRQAKNEASELRGEIRRNDVSAVKQTLRDLEARSDTARGHSDNFLWDLAAELPFFGDDIEAVQVMARSLAEASHDVTEPATSLLAQVQGDSLRDKGGRVNLTAVRELTPALEQVSTALQRAAEDVDAIDPDKLVSPLRDVTTNVRGQLDSMSSAAESGATVARLLPPMLGGDGPRRYLLVVQNNAETRATGGLPGSLSILEADKGQLKLGDQRAVDDFDVLSQPVLPLTPGERAVYGDNMGENIRDTNVTPDFPRAASLMAALNKRTFGNDVDGVISVDPVVLASVLKATGSIKVGPEKFTADNVVDKLLNEVYLRIDSREKQDLYFNAAARGIFDTLITRNVAPLKLIRELSDATSQRRLLVWSSHPEEQEELAGSAAAGELPADEGSSPQVGLYLNDGTAGKIEYYLDYTTTLRSASCTDQGVQTLQVGTVLQSSAPRGGFGLSPFITGPGQYAPKGTMRLNLRLYAPAGGEILKMTGNGRSLELATHEHDGRQVAIVTMLIDAREEVRVSAEIRTRAGQRGDPELQWTPGVRTRTSGVTATSSC